MPARVYVIELDRDAGPRRDPRIPWVYVGSTGRSIETRFEQHRRGYKSAGIVKRFGRGLRPDLYEDLPAFPGSKTALAAELKRAAELAGAGFVAHCDGTSYGRDTLNGGWEEWDAPRLAPVRDRVVDGVAELRACSFVPLGPDRCTDLLHGVRAFWVSDHLDQVDPPPAYGRFAHVSRDALAEVVSEQFALAPTA